MQKLEARLVGCGRGSALQLRLVSVVSVAVLPIKPCWRFCCPPQAWGAWWALTLYARYVRCLAAKRPFCTQAWSRLPFGTQRLRDVPFEPFVKVLLPLFGVLGGAG